MNTFFGRHYKALKRYQDRHGKWRTYYRPTGKELPDPGSVKFREFDQAYWDAVAGVTVREPKAKAVRSGPETVEKAVRDYLNSAALAGLAADTQRSRASLLNLWVTDVGQARLSTLRKADVEDGIASRTPTTGKNWFYAVRALTQWCMKEKRYGIKADPTQGVELKPIVKTGGFQEWTEADVIKFTARWAKDTMQYRALHLLLSWGQRRSDIVKFGWHKIEEGGVRFEQQKTKKKMLLPMTPALREILPPRPENVVDLKPMPFLMTTPSGQRKWRPVPFTPTYFTQWFGDACNKAGLPDLCVHGTRKLAIQRVYRNAKRAGRSDATAIAMAFSGHKTEKQLRDYLGENFEQEEYAGELVNFMR